MAKTIMISITQMATAVIAQHRYEGKFASIHIANDIAGVTRDIHIAMTGETGYDRCLNFWGANIHHIKGGLWQVCGHHHGEAEETISKLRQK